MTRHNWITAYSLNPNQHARFDEPEGHWLEMQQRLNRWGGGQMWRRLEQLGQIAKTNSIER